MLITDSCLITTSESLGLPELPCPVAMLQTVAEGVGKVKRVAVSVFKEHKAVLALTAASWLVSPSLFGAFASIAAAVSLVGMNLSAQLESRSDQPSLAEKAAVPLDGTTGVCAILKDIALTTLKEMVAIATVTAIAACFVVTELGALTLAAAAVATVCMNLFLRTVSAALFLAYAERDPETNRRTMPEGKAKNFIDFVEHIAPLTYGYVHFNTLGTVVHEGGHALAARAMYSGAQPQIVLFPYVGGVTGFIPKTLSWLGNLVGGNRANMAIAAAGPAAAVGMASAELALADHFAQTHPRLSRYLKAMGCLNIASHIFYAHSAFAEAASAATADPLSGHDFVRLWAGGVHPYVSIVSMVALPLIVKTGIYLATSRPEAASSTG